MTTNDVETVAEILAMEIDHLGADAFTVEALSDEEITRFAKEEMGLVPVSELDKVVDQVVQDDPDLREMYRAIRCVEYAETRELPDLEELQALLDAEEATRAA